MSINVDPATSGTPQVVRGTPISGEDIQHVLVADTAGNLVGTKAVGTERAAYTTTPAVTATGTIASATDELIVDIADHGGVVVTTAGTWTGNLVFTGSINGTSWYFVRAVTPSGANFASVSTNEAWVLTLGAYRYLRIRPSSWTSGTATLEVRADTHSAGTSLVHPIPTGTNTIGNIGNTATGPAAVRLSDGSGYLTATGGRLAVDNTGLTQPVGDAGGSLTVDSPQLPSALVSDRLAVDGSGVTQPVSISGTLPVSDNGGSLTVDAPQASPLHTRLTDGTNNAAITNTEPTSSTYGIVTRAIQQSTPTYWAVFDRIAPATNKYMAVLWNSTSTRLVKLRRIWRMDWQAAAVVGVLLEQELRQITARTGVGTTVTPVPIDSADTLTAGIEASHAATGVTDGGMLSRVFAASEEVILAATGQVLGFSSDERYQIVYEESRGSAKPITLRQNRGIAIKNITASTIGSVSYIFEFTDEAV